MHVDQGSTGLTENRQKKEKHDEMSTRGFDLTHR